MREWEGVREWEERGRGVRKLGKGERVRRERGGERVRIEKVGREGVE